MSFKTPIVLFVYNRIETVRQVFAVIKYIQPTELFIVVDGPRTVEDKYKINAILEIFHHIDWDCNLRTNFSETNLGCANRIISGLNWTFTFVDKVIVLEDDCLPHPTFFRYCEELLNYYQDDKQVMHISGFNIFGESEIENSYFFSKFILPPWGWATWRRAWSQFNIGLDTWQQTKTEAFQNISQEYFADWTDMFEDIRVNKTTWDVPWNVDIWKCNGVSIIPKQSLVQNIGFGETANFTKKSTNELSNIIAHNLNFPIKHPKEKIAPFEKQIEKAIIEFIRLNVN